MNVTISVDTGGTFTDCVVVQDKKILRGKSPTTLHNVSEGVINAIRETCKSGDISFEEAIKNMDMFRYATTGATNMEMSTEN